MFLLPEALGLRVERLHVQDAPRVQALCEASRAYHELVGGEPAGPEEGFNVLTELPPGRSMQDKFVFGFVDRDRRLAGVLDLVRGYRADGEWYLGLLLLDEPLRGSGAGSAIVSAVLEWLRSEGARLVRLAVAEQNVDARRFWERQGFRVERAFPPRKVGRRQTVLAEYVREP